MFSTKAKGVRYMEMAEGYITRMALDDDDQVIGYEFVKLGKMLEDIRHGVSADEALKNNTGSYGRFNEAKKYIDPRRRIIRLYKGGQFTMANDVKFRRQREKNGQNREVSCRVWSCKP